MRRWLFLLGLGALLSAATCDNWSSNTVACRAARP